jgi:hypothetical protein
MDGSYSLLGLIAVPLILGLMWIVFGTRLREETEFKPKPMDTLRESVFLNELWSADKAPWKNW